MPASVRLGDHGQKDQKCRDVCTHFRFHEFSTQVFSNKFSLYRFLNKIAEAKAKIKILPFFL